MNAWRSWRVAAAEGWNRFWFTPVDPAVLCLIRVLAGGMLLYTHLVWTLDLDGFFGPQGWLSDQALRELYHTEQFVDFEQLNDPARTGPPTPIARGTLQWSHFQLSDAPAWRWGTHFAALAVFALLTLGLWTRPVSILACLFTMSYMHRAPCALFGLDKLNMILCLYLAVGPSGACFSLDHWRRMRRGAAALPAPSVAANIALRLLQTHMCVLYFFAGVCKLQGSGWWNGYAMWMAFSNLEYQSLDMTWLADWPRLLSVMCHVTILWEVGYPALVWPRLTRPITLTLAVPLHIGISLCLGMITFGLVMLVGNAAFLSPEFVRHVLATFRPKKPKRTSLPGERGA